MKIHSKIKDYSVDIIEDILDKKKEIFSSLKHGRLFYFIDENFYNRHKKKLDIYIDKDFFKVIPAKEINKEYAQLTEYYEFLINAGFTRNDVLVTFGGGILQDISGFVASTLYRGIKWAFFPTTLLAQADSCIGSKTSINFGETKNLIGSFYPPDFICIDPSFSLSLSEEYFRSGLGEIIKFHLMSDSDRYELFKRYIISDNLKDMPVLKDMILSTLMIKKSYFDEDEFDTGRRNLLNYGHCFGHALESASNFKVLHGEAVLIGMGFANLLSLKRGIMIPEKYEEFESMFRKYYPSFKFNSTNAEDIIKYLKRDKKRIGEDLTMILSEDVGKQYKLNDIKEREIKEVYREFIEKYPKR